MAVWHMALGILFLGWFLIAPHGTEAIKKAGSLASYLVSDVRSQICPSDNPFKRSFVRIKTFNGKYWHATPSGSLSGSCFTDNSLCVKTRCCGSEPSMNQRDVTEPGRRTTFKVHCERSMTYYKGRKRKTSPVVMFELLNHNNNGRSNYYLCNADDVSEVFPKHFATQDINNNFGQCMWILHQYRGSVIGLEPLVVWKWTSFDDNGYGIVRHGKYKGHPWPIPDTDTGVKVKDRPTPFFDDTYTLEIVPQECLDVTDSQKIQAAKTGTTVAECEEAEDRCFMNNGWTYHTTNHPSSAGPKCYYKKDTPCFQPNVASRRPCEDAESTGTPEKCATANANCCYDYGRNTCYQALKE